MTQGTVPSETVVYTFTTDPTIRLAGNFRRILKSRKEKDGKGSIILTSPENKINRNCSRPSRNIAPPVDAKFASKNSKTLWKSNADTFSALPVRSSCSNAKLVTRN